MTIKFSDVIWKYTSEDIYTAMYNGINLGVYKKGQWFFVVNHEHFLADPNTRDGAMAEALEYVS